MTSESNWSHSIQCNQCCDSFTYSNQTIHLESNNYCITVCFFDKLPKQNARSLLTPVSDPAFYALSHGSKHFLLHGSSNNRLFQRFWLAVEEFWPIRKWLKKLPWRAKLRLPCERAWKAGSETGVESDLAFCLGSLFKKTNSGGMLVLGTWCISQPCIDCRQSLEKFSFQKRTLLKKTQILVFLRFFLRF